jgi:hypothetical protein
MGIFGWSLPPGCGTLPGEEDYDDSDETPDALTPKQKGRITRIRNRLDKATKAAKDKPVPTFADIWGGVAEYLASSGKTKLESEEAGEWAPWHCDDCQTWHKTAYSLDYDSQGEVMEGEKGPVIEARSCDQDGNWDFDSASFEGDKFWPDFYRAYISSDDHFAAWCRYHLWSAENGGADPLEEYYSGPQSVDANIDAALRNLHYLEGRGFMRRRKTPGTLRKKARA